MKCKTIHKKLIFYIEGELPLREMQEIARHLDECTGCAAFAEDMKTTFGIIEQEKILQDTPYFYTRMKARMQKQQEEAEQTPGFSLLKKALQPALFFILLLVGIYSGIMIGNNAGRAAYDTVYSITEIIPYLNELQAEPLEMFLMD